MNFENPEKARVFADKQGLPLFVKPANTGSSIGISKVMEISELDGALEKAFKIDDQILIEKAFVGREIEFAVLNNLKTGQLEVSPPGEIKVYGDGFYSYEAKYLNPEKVELIAPAAMDEASLKKAQKIAIDAFEALECKDFARVDLFVGKNEIYVNEINTLPGFTGISMFPKLWILAGFSYQDLLSNVVFSALKRQNLNLFENFSDKLKELNLL